MKKITFFVLLVTCLVVFTAGNDPKAKLQAILTRIHRQAIPSSNNATQLGSSVNLDPLHVHSEDCGCGPPATAPPGGGGGVVIGGDGAEYGWGSNRNNYGYGYEGDKWGDEYRNNRNQYGYELD